MEMFKKALSWKLKTTKEIREKSGNFAKFSGKLKFLALKKCNVHTLHSLGMLPI